MLQMTLFRYWYIICIGLLLLVGCGKSKPQLPSNKPQAGATDSTLLSIVELNQTLAEKADAELAIHVANGDLPYVRHELGFWYLMQERTSGADIQPEQTVELLYKVYLLDGTLCEDIKRTARVGKKEVLEAIDCILPQLHAGEKVEILAPWYMAYGREGDESIGILPYQHVKIELIVNLNYHM